MREEVESRRSLIKNTPIIPDVTHCGLPTLKNAHAQKDFQHGQHSQAVHVGHLVWSLVRVYRERYTAKKMFL